MKAGDVLALESMAETSDSDDDNSGSGAITTSGQVYLPTNAEASLKTDTPDSSANGLGSTRALSWGVLGLSLCTVGVGFVFLA